ncbi:unnamed protein product, partial [Symbiodinium necroappetens]
MAPKPAAKTKGGGKAASKDNLAPTTKLEFGYPQALTTALQAISSRATHDLWHAPSVLSGDPTAEQLAQRHANALAKLSKRLVGDMKAKEELTTALSQWAMTIGQHLAQLVERVRALSSKLDEDLIEACSETETMTTGASLATTERLQQARAALGPIWTAGQEQELFRIAACLRAFGTVADETAVTLSGSGDPTLQPAVRGSALPVGTGLVRPATVPTAAAPTSGGRWQKRRSGQRPERPSKSPRRDIAATVPWVAPATGRSPEGLSRVQETQIEEDEEMIPDVSALPPSWLASWLRLAVFAISNGSDLVGELAKNAQQDTLLPLHSDGGLRERALGLAEEAWSLLQSVTASGDGSGMADLYMVLQDALQHLRLCPEVLPHIRQGLLLSMHLTLGVLLDPYSYAPATAQEWLYPALLVESKGPFSGFVPQDMAKDIDVQVLLTVPCPYAPPPNSGPDQAAVIGSALGSRRLLETINAFPVEQYVLSPRSLPWNLIHVPVDLRQVCKLPRRVSCAELVMVGSTDLATTQDRFALSTWDSTSTDADFQAAAEYNAVVLSPNGLFYVHAPAFTEHTSLRSAVLADYKHQNPQLSVSDFSRVLPPLASLPPIQFVAMHDADVGEPGATPASRLRAVVFASGEPIAGQSVEHLVLAGRFRVLHREVLVDPNVAIRADPPIALVVTPAAAPISVSAVHLQQPRDRIPAVPHRDLMGGCAGRRYSLGLMCLLMGGWSDSGVFGCILAVLLPWARAGSGDDVEWSTCEQEAVSTLQEQPARYPGLASLGAHRRLSDILYAHSDCRPIGGPLAASQPNDRSVFCVELWSPASRSRAFFPASVTTQGLRSKVKQASELPRGTPVLVHPQAASRSVQFVSPSTSPQIVTIVVDTGLGWHCIDVPRAGTGQAILAHMCQLHPGSEYRLGSHPTLALRHGDVILACQDVLTQPLAGIIRLPADMTVRTPPGDVVDVAVSAADLGLIRVRVPSQATKEGIMSALTRWLGRQRCLGVGLYQVQVPGSTVQLFCLPRRDRSTLTAVLTDLEAEYGAIFVTTVDDVPGEALTCADLATASDGLGVFWADVLRRNPICVARRDLRPRSSGQGEVWRQIHLNLDYCRADSFGWRPVLEPGPALYDLVTHPPGPSVDWYLGGSATMSVATQTTPSHWPLPASPLYSDGLPVRRRPVGCALAPGMYPAGTLHHLDCPHFGVYCTIPCVPGYKLWAFRLGQWVRGACTATLTWNEVMAAASMTPWDLSGSMIHGENQVWVWPADVASLEGQCGHLFHEGSDPYLCGKDIGSGSPPPEEESEISATNHGRRLTGMLGIWGSLFVCAAEPQRWRPGFSLMLLYLLSASSVRSPVASFEPSEAQAEGTGFDATQTCNIGWCHELACQTTHLAVSSRHLLAYFSHHSPYATIRVSLWTPFQGPVLFDIHRGSQLSEFDEFLLVSGHDPDRHSLYVAFDTHATSPDILSVPNGDTVWWLVRDGLSRELLRPVMPWYEPPDRLVATINSHGQASTVTFSPEVSTMRRLPQGARGNTAVPMSTVIGHLTAQGLVLMEIAIGSLTAARELTRSHACTSSMLLLAWLPLVWGMQPAQDLAVRTGRRTDPWGGAVRAAPAIMRIWTHTLEAPLTLPFQDVPDTSRLLYCVACTRRGVPSTGEFIWTQPRIVQDVAHILHIPMGAYPTLVFWLLHFRARATVVAAAPGVMDWGLIGQTAHEAFGESFFSRGSFSIQYHSGVISYGTAVTPPHGAILHLVRAVTVPQVSANIWESTAEPAYVSHFDYDICMGPRGEPTLVEGDQVSGQPGAAHSQGLTRSAEAASLARQVSHISHQLDTLTMRLESVGVLPSSDAEEVPAASASDSAEPGDRSASPRPNAAWLGSFLSLIASGGHLRLAIVLSLSLQGIPGVLADGSEGSDSGPAEPSSPDLDDWQPPTPTASEPPTASAMPILRPSGSSLARTSAPFEGPEAPVTVTFSQAQVPAVQRRVAAVLQGVDVEPGPVPFLPAGCPVFIHNPFTGQTQCPALSSRVGTSHQLTEVLQDYSERRGWQPIVSVQPQPDAQGVHFIPSAADERFVSVLFRNGRELRPRCIERDFVYGPGTEVPFGDRPIWASTTTAGKVSGLLRPFFCSGWRDTGVIHLHLAAESLDCRLQWVDSAEDVAFVQDRFAQLLPPPRTLMPVWPAPRQDCLTMVPGHSRALLLPRSLAVVELCRVIQYLTCWPFDAIRLPPALWASLRDRPQAPAHLRDGDVLDVLRENHARDVVLRDSALLKDHTLWTRTIRLSVPVAVRLWLPDVLHPVLTRISAGEAWLPERGSFTGRFPADYPGTWIPVTWCPCSLPHLVRASDRLSTVSVLHDSVDGVRSISTVTAFRASDCADDFHTLPQNFHVLGVSHEANEDVLLRDGDVLWDSFMYPDDALGPWASLDVLGDPTVAGLAGALIGKRSLWLYVLLQGLRV